MRAPTIADPTEYIQVRVDGLHRWLLPCRESEQKTLVKQLLPAFAADESLRAAWLAAAERNRHLDHRGCARVIDCGEHESGPYIVSQHGAGVPLSALAAVREGQAPFAPELVAHIGAELLDIVIHVEELDSTLNHLDLDPAGVLVDDDGSISILPEFGLWATLAPARLVRCRFDCGRVSYTSPELVRAQRSDGRSDVFSIGVVLFELLSGQRPYQGATQLLVALGIAEGKRPSIHEAAPHAPEGLRDVIEVMLATEPEQRFQSARAAKAALQSSCYSPAEQVRDVLTRYLAGAPRFGATRDRQVVRDAPDFVPPPATNWSDLAPPPLLLASGAPSASVAWSGPLPSSVAPRHSPSAGAMVDAAGLAVNDGRTQSLRPSDPAPLIAADLRVGRSAQRSPQRAESVLALSPRTAPPLVNAEPHVELRRMSFVSEGSKPGAESAWSPRASNGKWQDPSATLFRMKSRGSGAPVRRRTQLPFAAIVCLSAIFGFTAVTGLYLLFRLWQ